MTQTVNLKAKIRKLSADEAAWTPGVTHEVTHDRFGSQFTGDFTECVEFLAAATAQGLFA